MDGAELACVSTGRSSASSAPPGCRAPFRAPLIVLVALALAGCNANQGVNPSSQTSSQVWAGHYEDTNPYDPTSYSQNQTGRGGGR